MGIVNLANKRILIFGGGGFIGSNLTNLLTQVGAQVISFDHKRPLLNLPLVQYIVGDFFNFDQVQAALAQADIVVHAVSTITPGSSQFQYMQGYERDFLSSVRMLEEAAKRKIRVLFLSSGGTVYGESHEAPIPEGAPLNPINHYGCVKVCIEQVMRQFHLSGADFRIARISNAYGPGQNYIAGVGFIDAAIKSALVGNPVQIWGTGENARDYIYIDDICKLLAAFLEYDGLEFIINIGTGIGTTQNEIVELIKVLFPDICVQFLPKRNVDVKRNILDTSLADRLFNIPKLPLHEGIRRCVEALTAK